MALSRTRCFSFQGCIPKSWCLYIYGPPTWCEDLWLILFPVCTHTHTDGSYWDEILTLIWYFSFMTLLIHSRYICLMQVPPESCKSNPWWFISSCSPSSWEGTQCCLPSSCLLVLSLSFSVGWALLLLFCHSVVSNSLKPHGLQHARLL